MATTQISPAGYGTVPASAALGQQTCEQTGQAWDILRAVRDARTALGLAAAHVQTLQAMLSFLKAGQGRVVFASNVELCRRAGGIDERTLRRHVDRLRQVGFVARQDSPNGKRYRITAPGGGRHSFGLSLEPLFARADDLFALARAVEDERRLCRYLRKMLLARLARIELRDGETALGTDLRKTLRRKLGSDDYRHMLDALPVVDEAPDGAASTAVDLAETAVLPANDGQDVRHLSKSEKERLDSEPAPQAGSLSADRVIRLCTDAAAFASHPLRTWPDIERLARQLVPMMGIDDRLYRSAETRLGKRAVASTVLALIQMQSHIRNLPAYFQSVTVGKNAARFDIRRILAQVGGAAA